MKNIKTEKRIRLKKKVRSKIFGTEAKPRLSIFRSNKHMYAQLVDDEKNKTIAGTSDAKMKSGSKGEKAAKVGAEIATLAKNAKINEVVFDRNGFKYTGRVKLLADSARKAGLKF